MTFEEAITAEWKSLLAGNVTVGSYTFPVYRSDAEISTTKHFIMLRKEGGSFNWNKAAFFRTFVLILEIVTKFPVIINDKLVDDADEIIRGLIFNSPASTNLNVEGLIKVDPGSSTYLPEDDGSGRIYRKNIRFVHQVASETA
jgi:hypothetical protein